MPSFWAEVRALLRTLAWKEVLLMEKKKTLPLHVEYLSVEEMNELFDYCRKEKRAFLTKRHPDISLYRSCVINCKKTKLSVKTEYKGKVKEYITFLDGREDPVVITGATAYTTLKSYWPELPEIPEDSPIYDFISASPMIDYNEKYNNQRVEAWGYDLNSAYASVILQGWIDTTSGPMAKVIDPETEIGFDTDLDIQREGFSMYVFKKMETPKGLRNWVNTYYKKKKEAKNRIDKLKAKQHLNFAIGFLQRKNPWLRAWVVSRCNEYIKSLIDENTLFWNTDSIVSRVPRPDLEIGLEIGQWKLEHEGVVAYKGNTYQWNNDKPTYRGVPKTWFKGDFDLLKDDKPANENLFYFNEKEIKVCGKDII